MEIIRKAADLKCTGNLQLSVQIIDGLLASPLTRNAIKSLFGLSGLEHDEDFVSVIEVCAVEHASDVGALADLGMASPLSASGRRETGTQM